MPQPQDYPLWTVNRAHVFFDALELASRPRHETGARRPTDPQAAAPAGPTAEPRRRIAVTLALLLAAGALAMAGGLA